MAKSRVFANNKKADEIRFGFFLQYVKSNSFDKIADEAIKKYESDIQKLDIKDRNSKKIGSKYMYEIVFKQVELSALAEMKIIYCYKQFETSLKILLNSNYPDLEQNKLYKWESISDILKLKKIDIRLLDGFGEIQELREANNAIKHDTILNTKKLPIEFKYKKHLTYNEILSFYVRIEGAPVKFLKSLYEKINEDLYNYDNERLEKMVDHIEKTMDPKNAVEFANKILSKY